MSLEMGRRLEALIMAGRKLTGLRRVDSFTTPGKYYFVDPEEWTCTCPAYHFRGVCKHILKVLAEKEASS